MTIKTSDAWRSPSRGTPEEAIATFIRWGSFPIGQVSAAVREIYRLCDLVGMDASLLVSHAAVETGDTNRGLAFLDENWATDHAETSTTNRYNIAGIGVTDGGDLGYGFTGGVQAGRAFVVHHARYELPVNDPAWKHLEPYIATDPRFNAVPKANVGTVKTVAKMTGKWWTNPNGHTALVSRGNEIFPNLPEQGTATDASSVPTTPHEETPVSDTAPKTITFGKVQKFGYIDRQSQTADKPEGVGWDNLGKRNPKAVVLHRMVGSLTGTDSWFGAPSVGSLTDFGIGIKEQDGTSLSKVIYQWNDPHGYRAGWASGPVNGAYGDGLAIVNKYGINAVNRDCISIEISGQYNTAILDDEFEEIATFLAYFWDQMHIPYDKAPLNPATGISAVLFHQEYTLGTGKICPGPVVMNAIDDLVKRAVAIMKPYQTGTTAGETTTPPVVAVPDPMWSDPKPIAELATYTKADADSAPDGIQTPWGLAVWVDDDIEAIRDTTRRQEPKLDALYVGPTLKKGGAGHALWLITKPNGERWYYSDYYTCFLAADFKRTKD